jgi:hypothetical protein
MASIAFERQSSARLEDSEQDWEIIQAVEPAKNFSDHTILTTYNSNDTCAHPSQEEVDKDEDYIMVKGIGEVILSVALYTQHEHKTEDKPCQEMKQGEEKVIEGNEKVREVQIEVRSALPGPEDIAKFKDKASAEINEEDKTLPTAPESRFQGGFRLPKVNLEESADELDCPWQELFLGAQERLYRVADSVGETVDGVLDACFD